MEQIRALFEKTTHLSDKDWRFFSSKLEKRVFPRKSLLLEQGQTEKYLSFVEQGIIRLFIPREENDLTFGFVFENQFVSAYDSFLIQSPSRYNVEALKDAVVWSISYANLQAIYKQTSVGNIIGRHAAEDLFLKKTQRELSLLNDTAEERYYKLFEDRPDVIKYIPLKHIASYIGITPQALSRIRSRIS